MPENQFFAIFSESKHFQLYVAAQHQYKYDYYEHFTLSEKPLCPSGAEKQKFGYPATLENVKLAWSIFRVSNFELCVMNFTAI